MFSQSSIVRLITIFTILFLTACGGSSGGGGGNLVGADDSPITGGNTDNSTGGDTTTPTERDITVTVSGASGAVVLKVGQDELTFNGDGTETLSNVSYDTEVKAEIISIPAGQACLFSPSSQDEIIVDRTVTLECGGPSVSGVIKEFASDEPVPSASIRVTNSSGVIANLTSGSDGSYSLSDVAIDDRMVFSVTVDGYAPYSSVVTIPRQRPIFVRDIFLSQIDDTESASPIEEMNFSLNGVTVLKIPANGLLTSSGAAPSGQVNADITLLDGSSDPRRLPGQYELVTGELVESLGAISIVLKDDAGNELVLAPEARATLSIPVAQRALGDSINEPGIQTLAVFDESAGAWNITQIGGASFEGVTRTYQTVISQLSATYSVVLVYDQVDVSGCFIDLQGNRVAGVQVVIQGQDFIGLSYGSSNDNGNFLVSTKATNNILVYGLTTTRSQTIEITTETEVEIMDDCILIDDASTVITLTWGENPVDLDSQLFGPTTNSTERFHIYYVSREATVSGVTMFLDVDDTSSFGPEVTTIPQFPLPGTYEFFVDLFSGTGTIRNSPARVEVNAQGTSFVFSPGDGSVDLCWHVFDIEVDDNLKGTVIEKDNWVDAGVCDTGLQ